ncbi:MAG: hypothetical protein ABGX16_15515 [Pirellulales bacterium]
MSDHVRVLDNFHKRLLAGVTRSSLLKATVSRGRRCLEPCCQPCCPPPPVMTELCVQDPCTCCTYKVCVCLPACCTEDPCVSCRPGIFGRKIVTYTWPCCGHSIDVVMTKHGRTIVRG